MLIKMIRMSPSGWTKRLRFTSSLQNASGYFHCHPFLFPTQFPSDEILEYREILFSKEVLS